MGKTKRDKLRRELAQALHHIEIAEGDLSVVWQAFEGTHDDYAQLLLLCGQELSMVRAEIRHFWLLAWGKVPDNCDVYRC